jgi:hypothetical protein
VRHQQQRKRLTSQLTRHIVEVLRLSDSGIDQRRYPAGEQVRIVPARPRPRRGIAGWNQNVSQE